MCELLFYMKFSLNIIIIVDFTRNRSEKTKQTQHADGDGVREGDDFEWKQFIQMPFQLLFFLYRACVCTILMMLRWLRMTINMQMNTHKLIFKSIYLSTIFLKVVFPKWYDILWYDKKHAI